MYFFTFIRATLPLLLDTFFSAQPSLTIQYILYIVFFMLLVYSEVLLPWVISLINSYSSIRPQINHHFFKKPFKIRLGPHHNLQSTVYIFIAFIPLHYFFGCYISLKECFISIEPVYALFKHCIVHAKQPKNNI